VKEIFDIRAMLNGLRDRLIAESAERGPVLAALESSVAQLSRFARDSRRGHEYVETVWGINRILTEACPNARLRTILDSLARQTLRYSQLGLATQERRKQSVQHWQKLVEAIRKGDGAKAERVAIERVTDSRNAAIRALEPHEPSGASRRKRTLDT